MSRSLLLVVCLCGLLYAKPAPKGAPKPKEKKSVPVHVGTWTMHWSSGKGLTTFALDNTSADVRGTYFCAWGETQDIWLGEWSLIGDKLIVREWPQRQDGQPPRIHEWSVALDKTRLSGRLVQSEWLSAGAFSLVVAENLPPARID